MSSYNNMQLQVDFPGFHVEPKMTRQSLTENAPYYMMRLLTGAKLTPNPRGTRGVVSMSHFGKNFLLFEEDFDAIRLLMEDFCQSFINRLGYNHRSFDDVIKNNTGLFLEAMTHAKNKAKEIFFVPETKVKVFWIIPDAAACGYYRSTLPRTGMQSQSDVFFMEAGTFFSYTQLSFYDVIVYHRCPPPAVLEMLQRLKVEGKTLIFDTDDDLFDIPEWNPCRPDWTLAAHERTKTSIEIADYCVVSTDHLKTRVEDKFSGKQVLVCPNLLDVNFYKGGREPVVKQIVKKFVGFKPQRNATGGLDFIKRKDSGTHKVERLDLSRINFDQEYKPITISWFGSPTHDQDIVQLVNPIKFLMDKYGIAIRFVFFGSIPAEFATMEVSSGNLNASLGVNPIYRGLMEYIAPVQHQDFPAILRNMQTDIGLCPLADHDFNLSKSNIKVLEFAMFGAPCVASDFGPYKFIRHGENGLKVNGTPESWVSNIEKLILDHEYRAMLGMGARKELIENYTWQFKSDGSDQWQASFDRMIELTRESRLKRRDAVLPFLNVAEDKEVVIA